MLSGAEILWECLVREGVELVFGYPGAAVLPLYDALPRSPVRHVLTRHEQGAAHMADGYARASGRVGVALATSGPGATNLTTGIATAMRDSIPCVFITGQVSSNLLHSDAFQEVDTIALTQSITKYNARVTDVRELEPTLRRAFALARSGRPGPVHVDVCRDAQTTRAPLAWPSPSASTPEAAAPALDARAIERAAELIDRARRPVILAGQGAIASGATATLRAFAEKAQIPAATTLLGIGGFPGRHPLCLGMMGMHGQACANHAIQRADLLLAFGMRFSDRVTGKLEIYAPQARRVHVDIDPREIGRKVGVDVGIVGDLREVLERLDAGVRAQRREAWLAEIDGWREDARRRDILSQGDDGRLHAPHAIHALWQATRGEAIVVTDVGQHQMWTAQYYPHERPRHFITSGGLGTMGFGLPAAIGAKLACPHAEVWLVAGDGGFQMTQSELGTLVQEGLDVKIAIINNGFLGMVRQWQELFYERRYTATPMRSPDFVALAAAYGIPAQRVARRAEIAPAIEAARASAGAALVEFRVEPEGLVYPMVPAGGALDAMLRRPRADEAVAV